jgi:ElaB/YqjD/DUF883 family membrane-anchored ribosome-binding protein
MLCDLHNSTSRTQIADSSSEGNPGFKEAAEAKEEELPTLYDKAFSDDIDRVVAEIDRVIRRSNFYVRHRDLMIGTAIGAAIGYVTSILSSLTLNWICGH